MSYVNSKVRVCASMQSDFDILCSLTYTTISINCVLRIICAVNVLKFCTPKLQKEWHMQTVQTQI